MSTDNEALILKNIIKTIEDHTAIIENMNTQILLLKNKIRFLEFNNEALSQNEIFIHATKYIPSFPHQSIHNNDIIKI